jgi:integrase
MARRANGEGSEPRFDASRGKWVASLRVGGGKRKLVRGDTAQEVRETLRGLSVDRDRGLTIPSDRLTLGQYLRQWIAEAHTDQERRSTTLRGYGVNIENHIIPHAISRVRLGQVQPRDVQQLLRSLRAKGLAERTVGYIHATLRVALADALELELIARNPAQVAKRKGRTRGQQSVPFQIRVLDEAEARHLLEVARGERLEALINLALVGLRRGELLGLRWCDVDLAQRELRVVHQLAESQDTNGKRQLTLARVKTDGSVRTVALPVVIARSLEAHRERQIEERRRAANLWVHRDLVFCNAFGGGLETTTLYRIWDAIRRRAGFQDVRLHDLRHSAASLLLAQGVELWEVSKILGHSTLAITADIYGHQYGSARRQAAARLDTILSANGVQDGVQTSLGKVSTLV